MDFGPAIASPLQGTLAFWTATQSDNPYTQRYDIYRKAMMLSKRKPYQYPYGCSIGALSKILLEVGPVFHNPSSYIRQVDYSIFEAHQRDKSGQKRKRRPIFRKGQK